MTRPSGFFSSPQSIASITLRLLASAVLALTLAACSDNSKRPLPGERIPVVGNASLIDPVVNSGARAEGAQLGPALRNTFFAAPGVTPRHGGGHLAVAWPLERVFTARVGIAADSGTDMAQPVANTRAIFTITPGGAVVATSPLDGSRLWEADIDPSADTTQPSVSGGLGLNRDLLVAHAGKEKLVALAAATGEQQWEVTLPHFIIAGPTVTDQAVVVTDITGRSYAFNAQDGEEEWNRIGVAGHTRIAGGGAFPAIFETQLVLAGGDGALSVLGLFDSRFLWGDSIAPPQQITALDGITDITAHPVHDGSRIYTITQSGVMVAYSAQAGRVLWDATMRGVVMPWLAGETLFVTTVNNELFAMRRSDGAVRWRVDLPGKYGLNDPVATNTVRHTAPLVVAGKVLVAGEGRKMLIFDAATGAEEGALTIGADVTTAPGAVAGSVFVLDRSGRLHVFR